MEEIRSFVAIELPDELKEELTRLQNKLKSGGSFSVKWVDSQCIHLTLKFLGNVAVDRVDGITRAIEEATKDLSPFRLEVAELGVFPNLRRVQIAWVGLGGEVDKLALLQKRLEDSLGRLGFPRESRGFTPHLTLARVRDRATSEERQQFGQLVTGTKFTAIPIEMDSVSLMKSVLTREGPIYTRISLVRLRSPLSTAST